MGASQLAGPLLFFNTESADVKWSDLTLNTPAASSLVSVAEAKAHLRVDHNVDDALIGSLIEVAVGAVEGPNGYGLALQAQTWSFQTYKQEERIPLHPVINITSVTDADDEEMAWNLWRDIVEIEEVGVKPYTVTFTAGYATVPTILKHAVLMMVAHLYHDREGAQDSEPKGFERIMNKFRVGRFGS